MLRAHKTIIPLKGRIVNGERGIRTLGEVTPTQTFQVCTLNRSVISPYLEYRVGEECCQPLPPILLYQTSTVISRLA